MLPKDLAKILKDYRKRADLSQIELANKLDFTQATISRIESGRQLPREAEIKRILELVSPTMEITQQTPGIVAQDNRGNATFVEEYTTYSKLEWNCFKASRTYGAAGGDVLLIRELKRNSQLGVLVGDSVGHGSSAAYMSFALEFAYTAIAAMLNPYLLSPQLFEKAMATGIVKTAKNWRGEPSMIILQLDLGKSQVSFVNRGMPYPILLDGDKASFITEKRSSAFSLQDVIFADLSFSQILGPAHSIFLYSDGLLDLIAENSLLQTMQKINKVFRGDSRAIGRNLIRHIEKNPTNKVVGDDVSFLVLSRASKRKK